MRRKIPRSPRTLAQQAKPETPSTPARWDNVLKKGPFLVSLSGLFVSATGLIITLAVNGPTLLRNGKDFVEWYRMDQNVSGRWTNTSEGDIEPPAWAVSDNDAVFLDVTVQDGQISGSAVSKRVCKYNIHTDVFVEGSISRNVGHVVFWDYIAGERRTFAEAKVHVNRAAGLLDFNVTDQAPGLFPSRFRLGKRSDYDPQPNTPNTSSQSPNADARLEIKKLEDAQFTGSFCEEFLESVKPSKKNSKK